jgi:manganese/zinc/iron transport system substrate-binding protein
MLLNPPEFEGAYDPHVWFDVSKWMSATEVIRDSFVDIDPEHAELYENNARDYLAELEELDRYVAERAQLVLEEKRVLITAHDAFNYFGEAYDFEVRGLQGISTASETGTADLSGLADFIVEREIPAIFVETSVPQRFVEALREAVAARGSEVSIGGSLYSDAMGDAGTPEGTYIGMVRHNIDTIVAGLAGRSLGGES